MVYVKKTFWKGVKSSARIRAGKRAQENEKIMKKRGRIEQVLKCAIIIEITRRDTYERRRA
ncbi:MAG: hypothetical protein ACK4Y7_05545 [Caldimicrobium sp.]